MTNCNGLLFEILGIHPPSWQSLSTSRTFCKYHDYWPWLRASEASRSRWRQTPINMGSARALTPKTVLRENEKDRQTERGIALSHRCHSLDWMGRKACCFAICVFCAWFPLRRVAFALCNMTAFHTMNEPCICMEQNAYQNRHLIKFLTWYINRKCGHFWKHFWSHS